MGNRQQQALSQQQHPFANPVVFRQVRQHRERRSELAVGPQARGTHELTLTAAVTSASEAAMARSVDQQIGCRLVDAVPAASLPGPLRLGNAQAEALSELLQVFACGEESASLAFAHLGGSPIEDAARRALARVAEEELIHERLLRGL